TKEAAFVTRLLVATTHAASVVFTSKGIGYKGKVWRLPPAPRTARGKALVNLVAADSDERINASLPPPGAQSASASLDVLFATSRGTVHRNKVSDFVQVNRNGKIAMKLEEDGDEILSVQICTESDDVLLTADSGQCIRFPVADVRVFA